MTEDHSHHHELGDPDGLTEKEKAAMRWQAIQGFNAAPVAPLAARLGIALICHMDTKKRVCYVGELRLSIELGAHILSIQKAKKQLRKAGLINWSNPGGPRHLSHFSFAWATLLNYSKQADDAAKLAIEKAQFERRNHSRVAAMDMPDNNSRKAVIKPFQKSPISSSITANSQIHHSQKKSHHSHRAAPITAVGLTDITLDITQKDVAQHITPSQANGGLGYADDLDTPFVSQQAEPRRALEGLPTSANMTRKEWQHDLHAAPHVHRNDRRPHRTRHRPIACGNNTASPLGDSGANSYGTGHSPAVAAPGG